jgi:hypothetical protein
MPASVTRACSLKRRRFVNCGYSNQCGDLGLGRSKIGAGTSGWVGQARVRNLACLCPASGSGGTGRDIPVLRR